MNDLKHIESLLNLFLQGKTTLEQERELSHFFARSHDIPAEWEPYKEMMAYFDAGMPVKNEFHSRRNISRRMWAVVVAAAAAVIIIMVAPNITNHQEKRLKPTPIIRARVDEVNDIDTITIAQLHSFIAKTGKKSVAPQTIKTNGKMQNKNGSASGNASFDAVEIEREKGEVEQAQQELLANKLVIERERQEVLDEQYAGRAQAYQAQQAFNNENPQFIQVVFK